MAKKQPAKMLAVLGRSRRTGRWRLAPSTSVLAVLGTCKLDMRKAVIEDEQLKITIMVVFGGATVMLPDGALVQPSGTSLLSASVVDVSDEEPEGDVPTIAIEWLTVFGRLRVMHDMVEEEPAAIETTATPAPTGTRQVPVTSRAVAEEVSDDDAIVDPRDDVIGGVIGETDDDADDHADEIIGGEPAASDDDADGDADGDNGFFDPSSADDAGADDDAGFFDPSVDTDDADDGGADGDDGEAEGVGDDGFFDPSAAEDADDDDADGDAGGDGGFFDPTASDDDGDGSGGDGGFFDPTASDDDVDEAA